MTKDNHLLGKFNLDGIPPAPRGVPQIEVTFDIDANGILNVTAQDKSSGKTQQITITNDKGRLSQEEVDRLIKESEKFKAADEEVLKNVQSKNTFEQYVYQVKNAVSDEKLKDKITEDDKKTVLDACTKAQQFLDQNQNASHEDFEREKKALETVASPIMQKLYQGMGQPGQGMPGQNMPGQGQQQQQQQPEPEPTNIGDID